MEAENQNLPIFGSNIDKSQVPPIHQKRILAFVNHFIVNTVTFLNKFVINCEMKFVDFERKLNRIESSLLIVEGKLSSITGLDEVATTTPTKQDNSETKQETDIVTADVTDTSSSHNDTAESSEDLQSGEIAAGVKACEDIRYRKYFKMLQFGVPAPAVRIKMLAEGVDAYVLDTPNDILIGGIARETVDEEI